MCYDQLEKSALLYQQFMDRFRNKDEKHRAESLKTLFILKEPFNKFVLPVLRLTGYITLHLMDILNWGPIFELEGMLLVC